MRIIVPMAGMGKRMRPHTLTVPKPLIPVAGKPIVQRLVEDIAKVCGEPVQEVAFIIGRFGAEVEKSLIKIAESVGAQGTIHYQDEPLGTAHAILCAQSALTGPVVVAFADTLFKADFTLDTNVPGTIWVQKVEDPKPFGVVKLNEQGQITDFVEKPTEFVSDLAIIGIYYFQDGEYLRQELQYLLDNDIKDKGEFQLTNALENMKNKGTTFVPGRVTEWLDCGNKDATVYTNQRYLEYLQERGEPLVAESAKVTNSVLIPPVYIGEGVVITDSVVGPHVSLGSQSNVRSSVVSNSIVQQSATVLHANVTNSMIGNFATVASTPQDLSLGDYNTLRV
ncbi:sugar phosphate nucleotidyltransferase [Hymenobacter sp. YC55]|uniref:sugar nucleotidyltransferase n=1 Tax=Hymenobacter sp. YC55 TaxID=3034019 RepID=UPI0023F8D559|nr:sugar phosphate nucleotidyltransferase [Hymenobacter sp. YC55]MDF7812970.1 sugar phosphate nucleotidyltransferase [Hymenobacter sp. YC55]